VRFEGAPAADMVNAHMVRKTGGVSRGALRVNVNEDIFLGYEMVPRLGVEWSPILAQREHIDAEVQGNGIAVEKGLYFLP
jgi:hypothetical protein